MKIKIAYTLYTDGDYALRNPEYFGCTGTNVITDDGWEHYDYVGEKTFENEDPWICKMDAKCFLAELLCDGIGVLYTHDYILKDFYDIIQDLKQCIQDNNSGVFYKELTGNYEGTRIFVQFL